MPNAARTQPKRMAGIYTHVPKKTRMNPATMNAIPNSFMPMVLALVGLHGDAQLPIAAAPSGHAHGSARSIRVDLAVHDPGVIGIAPGDAIDSVDLGQVVLRLLHTLTARRGGVLVFRTCQVVRCGTRRVHDCCFDL